MTFNLIKLREITYQDIFKIIKFVLGGGGGVGLGAIGLGPLQTCDIKVPVQIQILYGNC